MCLALGLWPVFLVLVLLLVHIWPTCLALSMRPRPHNQAPIYALIKILSLNLVCMHCYKQALQRHSNNPQPTPHFPTFPFPQNVCNANIFVENVWQQLFALPDSRFSATPAQISTYPAILPRPFWRNIGGGWPGHTIFIAFNAWHKHFHILFGWFRSQKPSGPSISAYTRGKKVFKNI